MNGLLLVNKPKNWTSFDVVAKVRSLIRQTVTAETAPLTGSGQKRPKIKVGHTGTLDPLATGLLVLAVGSYTKKVPELTKQDKTYRAEVTLGCTSTTDDAEGEITPVSSVRPTSEQVQAALRVFTGELQQIPPQFSAIKVGGVRAYKAARKGRELALAARKVVVYEYIDVTYNYPTITFTVSVGSGTYIRSLARDIGAYLKTGAYLSELCRLSVGEYRLQEAVELAVLTPSTLEKHLISITPKRELEATP